MSTNYTEHYNLCQWEPADKVLREDFNADNAKIDAALKNVQTTAETAKAQAQTITNAAYTKTDYPPMVTGFFSGNDASSREIDLGFRPKAVLLCPSNGSIWNAGIYNSSDITIFGGLATEHYGCGGAITITNKGFRVGYNHQTLHTNASGCRYSYIAFR